MTFRVKYLSLVCIFMIVFYTSLYAQKTVRIATLTDYPPACFTKKPAVTTAIEQIPPGKDSEVLQGKSWEIVREAYHSQGYTIVLHTVPISRAIHYVTNGTVDVIFPLVVSEERSRSFSFSDEPVITDSIVVYFSAAGTPPWHGLDSLNDKKIAVVRKWAYGKIWEKQTSVVRIETDSIIQCFQSLDNESVSGVVGYEIAFDYTLKSLGLTSKYHKSPEIDKVINYMMGNKTSKTKTYLDAYDKGYRNIRSNGILDKINKKWK